MRLFDKRVDAETRDAFQLRLWAIVAGLLLLVAYLVAFVVKNDARVEVDFVLFTAVTSVIWLILLTVTIGIVGGLLLSQLYRRRRGHEAG